MKFLLLFAFVFLAANAGAQSAFDLSHVQWNSLLKANVQWADGGNASVVDYAGFGKDRATLKAYLDSASAVSKSSYETWSKPDREAFLINVYNAATVELVLSKYPDLKSIKDIGGLFGSPWKEDVISLLGERRSLDEIEHEMLRGAPDYSDPRIHFAVNCASIGCPALRPEAYAGSRLDAQLADQTNRFLRDRSRNRYDAEAGLQVSKIFNWYGDDFDSHAGSVRKFLAKRADALGLDAATTAALESGKLPITYTDYDWRLNTKAATPRKP